MTELRTAVTAAALIVSLVAAASIAYGAYLGVQPLLF